MAYKKANEVLPEELLILIQDYIDGECLYIPRKETNKKAWGENTKSIEQTHQRNLEIYEKYKEGYGVKVLATMYCLSIKSIQGIILKIKKQVA
ncbi:MAG: CD3324 family protein [Cellulosilyticaceae bacterium]